ncbi:hypothetical protein [Flavobacterium sp.]|uniref:hypothetical protein n=1 Tax=Flavobacterium sp. TaxID=239 RepID=UPI00260F03CA|nr:hypothetical protein [Flavobacterium sp.]
MKNSLCILLLISLCFFSCKNESETNSLFEKSATNTKLNPLEKETNSTKVKATQKDRDQKIVGTWRHTEVISSGSGESYISMTTDDFIEFRSNGSVATWVGDAIAGNFESKSDGEVQEGLWNTNNSHNQIIFTDPATKQEARTQYYLENEHLMFSNGNSKKVYEKIN